MYLFIYLVFYLLSYLCCPWKGRYNIFISGIVNVVLLLSVSIYKNSFFNKLFVMTSVTAAGYLKFSLHSKMLIYIY